jgi:hypothetical protein
VGRRRSGEVAHSAGRRAGQGPAPKRLPSWPSSVVEKIPPGGPRSRNSTLRAASSRKILPARLGVCRSVAQRAGGQGPYSGRVGGQPREGRRALLGRALPPRWAGHPAHERPSVVEASIPCYWGSGRAHSTITLQTSTVVMLSSWATPVTFSAASPQPPQAAPARLSATTKNLTTEISVLPNKHWCTP